MNKVDWESSLQLFNAFYTLILPTEEVEEIEDICEGGLLHPKNLKSKMSFDFFSPALRIFPLIHFQETASIIFPSAVKMFKMEKTFSH